jgi:Ras family protein A
LCYDVSKRSTLESVQTKWITVVNTHYNYAENLPVMLLGLKRDARREWTLEEKEGATLGGGAGGGVGNIQGGAGGRKGKGQSVMPQEGLNAAQELLCDRYAECSALTGELCREVLEDVAKLSARTTTEKGAKTESGCVVM